MMAFLRKYFSWAINPLVVLIGKINWKQTHGITEDDKAKVMSLLVDDYYIILTRHANHLSTYMIGLSDLCLRGKMGFYGHALMNLEDTVDTVSDFRLLQATGVGTGWGTFEEVFGDADAVCLLKPKLMSIDEWTATLDTVKEDLGKPYDTLFDLTQDKKLSCVELVRDVLQASPNYATDCAQFEAMCQGLHALTPQMFRDCLDFEVVLEIKR
jgi:hypothetical protein